MERLKIELENCYGIRKLNTELDFSNKRAQLIYAPNGSMKSSFALTFYDHSLGKQAQDRVYPARQTKQLILDQDDVEISADSVFVIDPYNASYESTRVSTLLVNKELKAEYDDILSTIQNKQEQLTSRLNKIAGVKSGIEDVISTSFTRKSDNFLRALDRIRSEVIEDPLDSTLDGIKYSKVFNDKVDAFLSDPETKEALEDYTGTYDQLLDQSRFFRKGVFNHYQAGEIAKQLKNHGFFQADHKVYLNSGEEDTKVETEEELGELIAAEMDAILSDDTLKKKFDQIEKKLKNQQLREFREFLLDNQTLIPRLKDLEVFREDLLKFYLMQALELFSDLMDEYEEGKKRLDEITREASDQATAWQEVINIFNRRFSVPFTVNIENKQDVILKRSTPNIGFVFNDGSDASATVDKDRLLTVLSNGESRALYILNIIFEVEARKADGIPTIFIVDDIADSFDYKNKYAIVEYLNDILLEPDFRQIILTHNYDFYRTVWKRLDLNGVNYHVAKSTDGISLIKENMYRDPFVKWKNTANAQDKKGALLAMIPFVRNLADYCGFEDESSQLTSLLHIKPDSNTITLRNLFAIYEKVLNGHKFEAEANGDSKVIELINSTAQEIVAADEVSFDLEKKILLSVAIRLNAESKMIEVIDDEAAVKAIKKNQTAELISLLKSRFGADDSKRDFIALMDRVNLMTPENIHLNSFMYEPILDMSSEHLARLYDDVTSHIS